LADGDKYRFFVTCPRGTEGALRRELVGLRIGSPKGDHGGVWFDGPLWMAMGVCLRARTAVRVLMRLAEFDVSDAQSLYDGARAVDWSAWLTAASTLAVDASARDNPALTHSGFAALKVKDAVVDSLRDALGARPDVDPKRPDVAIVLHVAGQRGALFLDLAGEPLHRRGYRVAMTDAPLKETLAAAVLALGRVAQDQPFIDPMAGGGTLAIEHALAARGIAPGLRRTFGFERWPTLDAPTRAAWAEMRAAAEAAAMEHRVRRRLGGRARRRAPQRLGRGRRRRAHVRGRRRRDARAPLRRGHRLHEPALRRAPAAARSRDALPRRGPRPHAPARVGRRRAVWQPAVLVRVAVEAGDLAPPLQRPARGPASAL
jgi:23S rRNA G2445 N2-methylase RlmL